MSVKDLIKNEVDRLPESVLIQVYEFIQALEARNDSDDRVKSSMEQSAASFQRIWEKDDDAAYDNL